MLRPKKSRGIIREAVLLERAALKQSGFTHQILTDFINDAINEGVFPDSLKTAYITPAHKKKSRLITKTTDQWVYCLYYQSL